MSITGCGEVWTTQTAGTSVWALITASGSTWVESSTYCPLVSQSFYNSVTIAYDDATTDYDAI